MAIAVYVRVSSRRQDTKSQEPDLHRWVEAYAGDADVNWYRDKACGKTMDRPGWRRLEADMHAGKVKTIVVWRLDRLGRTASGLTTLFDELQERSVRLVSVRDGLDLGTPAGRLMANVLASVAAYENEVRSERIISGQAVARARFETFTTSRLMVPCPPAYSLWHRIASVHLMSSCPRRSRAKDVNSPASAPAGSRNFEGGT